MVLASVILDSRCSTRLCNWFDILVRTASAKPGLWWGPEIYTRRVWNLKISIWSFVDGSHIYTCQWMNYPMVYSLTPPRQDLKYCIVILQQSIKQPVHLYFFYSCYMTCTVYHWLEKFIYSRRRFFGGLVMNCTNWQQTAPCGIVKLIPHTSWGYAEEC